jgi:CheY-like chemotaxis protein
MSSSLKPSIRHILLADDDIDDRYFFEKVLGAIPIPTQLTTVEDGEKLMEYLLENSKRLPDILFLDLNMPKKNGFECMSEIRQSEKLKHLLVIIYSTSLHESIADLLYAEGAYYFVRKTDILELRKVLHHVLSLLLENKLSRPTREKFILKLNGEQP